jgi:hypothetical protein
MKQRRWKGIKVLILGVATAAFLVPVAHGYVNFGSGSDTYTPQAVQAMGARWEKRAEAYQASRPDDRAGTHGIGSVDTSDYVDRQLANLEAANYGNIVHADDRGGVRGPGPVETPAVVSTHDGFSWTDAGIGASVAAFLAAAMLAAVMLVRKRPSVAV